MVANPHPLHLLYPAGRRETTEGLNPDRAAKVLMAADYLIPDGNWPHLKSACPTTPTQACTVLKATSWMISA